MTMTKSVIHRAVKPTRLPTYDEVKPPTMAAGDYFSYAQRQKPSAPADPSEEISLEEYSSPT